MIGIASYLRSDLRTIAYESTSYPVIGYSYLRYPRFFCMFRCTSLSSIASDPDTDRYSFKLEFDHYIEGQTCYGLDKLILNNNYADATNMKEAVEDSFMLRNYGTEDGNEALQKTESGGV